jgi:hypothetical protein
MFHDLVHVFLHNDEFRCIDRIRIELKTFRLSNHVTVSALVKFKVSSNHSHVNVQTQNLMYYIVYMTIFIIFIITKLMISHSKFCEWLLMHF